MVHEASLHPACLLTWKGRDAPFKEARIRESTWKAPGLKHPHHAGKRPPPVRVKRMAQRIDPCLFELRNGLHDGIAFFDGVDSLPPPLDPGRFASDQDLEPDPSDAGRLDVKAARLAANAGVGPVPFRDARQRTVSGGLLAIRFWFLTRRIVR